MQPPPSAAAAEHVNCPSPKGCLGRPLWFYLSSTYVCGLLSLCQEPLRQHAWKVVTIKSQGIRLVHYYQRGRTKSLQWRASSVGSHSLSLGWNQVVRETHSRKSWQDYLQSGIHSNTFKKSLTTLSSEWRLGRRLKGLKAVVLRARSTRTIPRCDIRSKIKGWEKEMHYKMFPELQLISVERHDCSFAKAEPFWFPLVPGPFTRNLNNLNRSNKSLPLVPGQTIPVTRKSDNDGGSG